MLPCRFLISQNPEVEARIVEELRSHGLLATPERPQPRALEHADLSKLTYLSCAVKVRCLHWPGTSARMSLYRAFM